MVTMDDVSKLVSEGRLRADKAAVYAAGVRRREHPQMRRQTRDAAKGAELEASLLRALCDALESVAKERDEFRQALEQITAFTPPSERFTDTAIAKFAIETALIALKG
jgi:hypothetical protein